MTESNAGRLHCELQPVPGGCISRLSRGTGHLLAPTRQAGARRVARTAMEVEPA